MTYLLGNWVIDKEAGQQKRRPTCRGFPVLEKKLLVSISDEVVILICVL